MVSADTGSVSDMMVCFMWQAPLRATDDFGKSQERESEKTRGDQRASESEGVTLEEHSDTLTGHTTYRTQPSII